MSTTFRSFLLPLAVITAATTQAQVSLDFETAGQLSGNFRNLGPAGTSNTQSANGAGDDYLIHDIPGSSGNAAALLYDTTPGDTTSGTQSTFAVSSPITVSFDFRSTTAASSFGIIFADPTNASNNVLALFNIDNSGTTTSDLFRFFKDGNVGTGGVDAGSLSGNNQSVYASTGVNVGASFGHYSATLSVVGQTPTISLTVGTQMVSNTFGGATDFNWTNTTVILRLFDAGGATSNTTVDVDNFTIAAIPEPSTYAAIFGTAVLSLALLRRRRKV